MNKINIYVPKLIDKKYYIDKIINDVSIRFSQHKKSIGSE